MVATVVFDELHVTDVVRFSELPSLKFPVAVNCSVVPAAIDGFAGVTVIEFNTTTAALTVKVVEPVTVPKVALISDDPAFRDVANPPLLIVATVRSAEVHVTDVVSVCVLPSLKFPVAVNCWVAPAVIEGFAGPTVIDTNVAAVTVSVVEPFTEPDVAVMSDPPVPTLVASPCVPAELLMVATPVCEELQVTEVVRSWLLPSL
jgi:hypothetical protein